MRKILYLALLCFAFTFPPLSKGAFTGSVDLGNYWGNYYNNYVQSGIINISFLSSTLGGKAYVKIQSNGSSNINISGATIIRGVTNNSPWVAGNYECYFESTVSGITVNVLKY